MDAGQQWIAWCGFLALITALVSLDFRLRGRLPRVLTSHESLGLTLVWMTLAAAFSGAVYWLYSWGSLGLNGGRAAADAGAFQMPAREAAFQYLAACFIELALSLDNIFLIAAIFAAFRTPRADQRRVVFWGSLWSIAVRMALILIGYALLRSASWMTYVFAGLLLLAAVKLLVMRTDNLDPERMWMVRLTRRVLRVAPEESPGSSGERPTRDRFLTRLPGGALALTPLAVVLVAVETGDVLSGMDSIPAVFAVTPDPFLAFTSNVFAMLILRHLFFAVVDRLWRFRYLKFSLAFLLAYFGVKMALARHVTIDAEASLAVIAAMLGVGLVASYVDDRRGRSAAEAPLGPDVERVARTTVRQAWKAIVLVIGGTLLLLSPVVGALPGPGGILVFFLGLLILATEFVWAAQMLRYAKDPVKAREQAEIALDRPGWRWALPALRVADVFARVGVWVWNMTLGRVFGTMVWAPRRQTHAARPAADVTDSARVGADENRRAGDSA